MWSASVPSVRNTTGICDSVRSSVSRMGRRCSPAASSVSAIRLIDPGTSQGLDLARQRRPQVLRRRCSPAASGFSPLHDLEQHPLDLRLGGHTPSPPSRNAVKRSNSVMAGWVPRRANVLNARKDWKSIQLHQLAGRARSRQRARRAGHQTALRHLASTAKGVTDDCGGDGGSVTAVVIREQHAGAVVAHAEHAPPGDVPPSPTARSR